MSSTVSRGNEATNMPNAPLLLLNHSSPVAPYEQIGLQIRSLIASAQLLPGMLLPSVRQLADDLGVAPNTVVRAYKELEHDGWVTTSLRKRTMVTPHPPIMTEEERLHRLQQAVAELLIHVHPLDVHPQEVHAEIDRQLGSIVMREGHNG